MSDKETETTEEVKKYTPKFRFDFGVTLAVLAVIGLLFGIGSLSEMARNASSSSTASLDINVGGVEAEQLAQAFLNSQKVVGEKGVSEIYKDLQGNSVGVIVYSPADDIDTIVIYDVTANQYYLDSINSEQGGLSVNTLANSLDTLKDFNVIADAKGLYTIQPKQEGNNVCVGVSVKENLVQSIATTDCSTGELVPNTFTTEYQYGLSDATKEIYTLGLSLGEDMRSAQ